MGAYGGELRPDVATDLYAALMTDTGSFRFSNTTASSLTVAAGLLESGADHGLLIDRVYESYPAERFRLMALALQTLQISSHGRVAFLCVTREMYEATSSRDDLTEGFVDIPRSIQGVQVAALIREIGQGEHRVNLRSRGGMDVARVAARFGGGGHSNAAGCTIRGGGDAVRHSVLAALEEALQ
jgi:phosphoesterase RecJ-like protein